VLAPTPLPGERPGFIAFSPRAIYWSKAAFSTHGSPCGRKTTFRIITWMVAKSGIEPPTRGFQSGTETSPGPDDCDAAKCPTVAQTRLAYGEMRLYGRSGCCIQFSQSESRDHVRRRTYGSTVFHCSWSRSDCEGHDSLSRCIIAPIADFKPEVQELKVAADRRLM
jgi:hypothetical protein